ncbi:MAG TPA: hypothetical protein RMH99_29055 [Sandaracinaceae bacterium LLY-WYZ-13_1]|nr:hypothetical protein [Sandaracinaceae bacterium LLY-WYZ-13_1]
MSQRTHRTKRERFLPHAFERFGVTCAIHRVRLDEHRPVEGLDADRHLVALDATDWEVADLDGALAVPPEVIARVLPAGDRAGLVLTVRCPATRLRAVHVAGDAPANGSPLAFRVRLERDRVSGTVELTPHLVRSTDAPAPRPGHATRAGSRLASARPWTVRIDPVRDPAGQFLDTRYQAFSEDERLATFGDALYHLQVDESPILWINADHERIVPVLNDRGTRGPRARTREVVFDLVAHAVWSQLFVATLHDLEKGELVYEWQDSVLRELLPALYARERTHGARVERLREALERDERIELMARLDAELQRRHAVADHITKLVEAAAGKNA